MYTKTKHLACTLAVFTAVLGTFPQAFADSPYSTENPVLDKIFAKYEKDLRTRSDSRRLKQLSDEKSDIAKGKISEDLKDQVIQNQVSGSSGSDLWNDIAKRIGDVTERRKALGQLLGSMKKNDSGSYRLFVKSSLSPEKLAETFLLFDNAKVKTLSQTSDGKTAYELNFPYGGRLARFLGNKLDNGQVPDNLLEGVETIKPTLIQWLMSTGTYLNGEALSNLWGIRAIWATDYQYGLANSQKIKVGVIDTGINLTHPDLASNIGTGTNAGYNFLAWTANVNDDNGHGSHVAGIIGGLVNAKWVFWVDSNVTLIPLKALDANGYGSSYSIADAVNYAANNGIRVLNLSLGGSGNPANDIICNAITAAKSKGTVTVVAAGNENTDVFTVVPAGCADAITVGAVDSTLTKASFSNYGSKVDVSAPGINIYSTYLNGTYTTMNGTSMATPFISGLAAAILARNPSLSTDQIKNLLKDPNNTLPVSSSVNIGRFASMSKIMTFLWVQNDSLIDAPPTGSSSGTTSSWSTSSGTTNQLSSPTLTLASSLVSANTYKITATASQTGGTIVWYGFYSGSTLLSSWTVNSYQTSILGNTTITVKVQTGNGMTASKDIVLAYTKPVVIANQPPVLNLSFAAVSSRTNRTAINTSDPDGVISRVDIYINGVYKYYAQPNTQKFVAYLDTTRWIAYTIKVVSKDNKGAVMEKTITVK